MNGKEIIAAIEEKMNELSIDPRQLAEGDDVSDADWEGLKTFCGGYKCIECCRSNSKYYVVLHFIKHDVYIRFSGDYDSWSGTTWDGCHPHEVRPETKTITVFNRVKS